MIIGRLLIAVVLFIGMAFSASARLPSDVSCPSKTYLRSCPIDVAPASTPAPSSERPCPGKAILTTTIPYPAANACDVTYNDTPAANLEGAVSGGIERPPKFSLS